MLASGITFGFAAPTSVLVKEQSTETSAQQTRSEMMFPSATCKICGTALPNFFSGLLRHTDSQPRLNLTFNIASMTTNVSALLVGNLLDRHRPRFYGIIGSAPPVLGNLVYGHCGRASL